ncbi:hypothetical protein [Homoserinibacter gongjuensis]|uniref:Uncharacterized protein n=1 Tax=Homoserinibacter gongjuensis TaxID=1162968 RepID=A0ABQ6JY18_9MICO|nr:hypothetical protein [Homoserinibacter gongjuensis]GMA92401.1 hypothetical protein GCM10025869_29300 [Homoserinibacter gongjuensis]
MRDARRVQPRDRLHDGAQHGDDLAGIPLLAFGEQGRQARTDAMVAQHGGAHPIIDDIHERDDSGTPSSIQCDGLGAHHAGPDRVERPHEHGGPRSFALQPHEPTLAVRVASERTDDADPR